MAKKFRDKSEGQVVFATSDKILASIFMTPTNDTWTASGLFGNVHYFICSDKEKFLRLDKGGAIYTLSSESFTTNMNKGLGTKEWTSKIPVRPIKKKVFNSALSTMLKFGIQVYFMNGDEFEKLKKSSDHGNKILRENVSENQKRKINIIDIPKIS